MAKTKQKTKKVVKVRLVLRGPALLERSGEKNAHRLGMRAGLSAPTVSRYIDHPEVMVAVDLETLPRLLMAGLGMGADEMLALKLSDIFEIAEA